MKTIYVEVKPYKDKETGKWEKEYNYFRLEKVNPKDLREHNGMIKIKFITIFNKEYLYGK